MVEVKLINVTKMFGDVAAVDKVSITVAPGELFFVLGPSGCGKTTLLRLIAGFINPDEGEIWFGDRLMNEIPAHKRNAAMVFQNYALFPHMTVFENVAYGLRLRKLGKREIAERVERCLELVRMSDAKWRYPGQLSGGQQQRVALARALAVQPDVLLLDEPLSNLDAQLRKEMRHELKRIHSQLRITTIYVTHDQKEALAMADRIAVMRSGRVVQVGTPYELYRKPSSKYVAEFIGDANVIEGVVQKVKGDRALLITPLCAIECHCDAATDLIEGMRTAVAIRPEAVQVALAFDADIHAANEMRAKVIDVTYMGDEELLELSVKQAYGEWRMRALRTNPHERVLVGDEVILKFDPSDVILIPPNEHDE
ncbi:MAG: ABC transporter ATP-binding protein [Armatimonadota bacterium]|nr:ABC transporter ATP-binding protein [Armatimonadota bacterium]MCX7777442.1 ABC transporter ATP-binding protein [Armatimonadota bacterium]MDW8025111.1 ABC transporter ATP-binding protein [Armatimonadota bacterium]